MDELETFPIKDKVYLYGNFASTSPDIEHAKGSLYWVGELVACSPDKQCFVVKDDNGDLSLYDVPNDELTVLRVEEGTTCIQIMNFYKLCWNAIPDFKEEDYFNCLEEQFI